MFIVSSDTLRVLVTKSTQGQPPHRLRRGSPIVRNLRVREKR